MLLSSNPSSKLHHKIIARAYPGFQTGRRGCVQTFVVTLKTIHTNRHQLFMLSLPQKYKVKTCEVPRRFKHLHNWFPGNRETTKVPYASLLKKFHFTQSNAIILREYFFTSITIYGE